MTANVSSNNHIQDQQLWVNSQLVTEKPRPNLNGHIVQPISYERVEAGAIKLGYSKEYVASLIKDYEEAKKRYDETPREKVFSYQEKRIILEKINKNISSIEESQASIKESLADIKESLADIKESQVSIKESLADIKESQVSIRKDLNTMNRMASSVINKMYSVPYERYIESYQEDGTIEIIDVGSPYRFLTTPSGAHDKIDKKPTPYTFTLFIRDFFYYMFYPFIKLGDFVWEKLHNIFSPKSTEIAPVPVKSSTIRTPTITIEEIAE